MEGKSKMTDFFEKLNAEQLDKLCKICGFKNVEEARKYYKIDVIQDICKKLDWEREMTYKDKENYLVRLCWDLLLILSKKKLSKDDKDFMKVAITEILDKIK